MSAFEANMLRTARCHFVKLTKTTPNNVNMKTMQIRLIYVMKLTAYEICRWRRSAPIVTNSGQNENVSKTIGGSKNFEYRIRAKSEIVKKSLGDVTFLTTPNRHVRESICFMQRAERCKIEEIGLM